MIIVGPFQLNYAILSPVSDNGIPSLDSFAPKVQAWWSVTLVFPSSSYYNVLKP